MIWSAFILGLIGSLHCVGMCGPIALAVPFNRSGITSLLQGRLLYNAGRIITYSLMGFVAGTFGMMVSMTGFQDIFSVTLGIILLLSAGLYSNVYRMKWEMPGKQLTDWLKRSLSKFIHSSRNDHLLVIGILNGLLPCGLVYAALSASLVMNSPVEGMGFMALFGAGTFPLMFLVSISGKMISLKIRSKMHKVFPYVTMLLGVLLILRGLNLGIPFISPVTAEGADSCCHQ